MKKWKNTEPKRRMTDSNNQNKVKPTLAERFKRWLNGENYKQPTKEEIQEAEELERESRESAQEDSEGDGLMEFNEPIFPEEI